jgi:uncharacterized protein
MKIKNLILCVSFISATSPSGSYAMEKKLSYSQLVPTQNVSIGFGFDKRHGGNKYHHDNTINNLFIAIEDNEPTKVKTLLSSFVPTDSKSNGGQTPLMFAAYKGYADIVVLLLVCRWKMIEPTLQIQTSVLCEIDAQDNYGNTALALAAGKGNKNVVKKLLEGGASVSIVNCRGATAIKRAQESGYTDVVELLQRHEGN